jgi:hypothetical protein
MYVSQMCQVKCQEVQHKSGAAREPGRFIHRHNYWMHPWTMNHASFEIEITAESVVKIPIHD